jgi:neural Wiskott-Aldrich syndrome protein
MSPDPNKKIPRQFQCRESLWQKFEQMAKELECSVDYLINDAMKQYARQRGYAGATASQRSDATASVSNSMGPSAPYAAGGESMAPSAAGAEPYSAPTGGAALAAHHVPTGPHLMQPPGLMQHGAAQGAIGPGADAHGMSATQQVARFSAVPQPGRVAPPIPPAPPPAGGPRRVGPPPIPGMVPSMPPVSRVPGPPPLPNAAIRAHVQTGTPVPFQTGASPHLQIHYQGQSFPITKDKFIIGRGKQTSDLTIKDPNVSRQHAMIEFDGAQYCIVDLGSTNGIEFQGQRVQRKILADGDLLRICDHELLFSYY